MKGINWSLKLINFYQFIPLYILLHSFSNAQGSSITGRAYDEADKKFGPVRVVIYDQDKKKVFEERQKKVQNKTLRWCFINVYEVEEVTDITIKVKILII